MKKVNCFLIFLLIAGFQNSKGQCIANAGPDRVICSTWSGIDTTVIGGMPAVTGGQAPYTYSWEANYVRTIGSITVVLTASDFLDDTTVANPSIIAGVEDSVLFIFTVRDSLQQVCSDSVLISFSRFYSHLGFLTFNINSGDSIYLNYGTNVFGNRPPMSYLWQPTLGLEDSTSLSFWAKPPVDVAYYLIVTDSAGCSITGSPLYYINVSNVGIGDRPNALQAIQVQRVINDNTIHISSVLPGQIPMEFKLYNLQGKVLLSKMIKEEKSSIPFVSLATGYYLYSLSGNGQQIQSGKLYIH